MQNLQNFDGIRIQHNETISKKSSAGRARMIAVALRGFQTLSIDADCVARQNFARENRTATQTRLKLNRKIIQRMREIGDEWK